jgi:hypothetical protein
LVRSRTSCRKRARPSRERPNLSTSTSLCTSVHLPCFQTMREISLTTLHTPSRAVSTLSPLLRRSRISFTSPSLFAVGPLRVSLRFPLRLSWRDYHPRSSLFPSRVPLHFFAFEADTSVAFLCAVEANPDTEVLELLSSQPADQEQIEQEAGAGTMYQLVLEMDVETWQVRSLSRHTACLSGSFLPLLLLIPLSRC